MKLSSALVVSAASMTAAVDDAPLLQKDIGSVIVSAASAVGDTSSLLTGIHHHPTASTHVRESLPRSDNMMAAVATSALLQNEEHTSSGGSKNVDVDVGLLQFSERHLSSTADDCTLCTSSTATVIEVSGTAFKSLVSNCYNNGDDAKECPYNVPIGCWDTSEVTDMASAFNRIYSFDGSINCWNTARVTTMYRMFTNASKFNQPLDDWDVASVTDMEEMFGFASIFNQPLNDWNVASVTVMATMFFNAPNFNQPLNNWNVASVDSMFMMFSYATNFNQPLDDWNVASVTDMKEMFYEAPKFNQCLSMWADKTPPNVSIDYIFDDSGCPDQSDPDPSVGPWCQGDNEQCFAPSATPSDFPSSSTSAPSAPPTSAPSASPTSAPSASPTSAPSALPTLAPSTPPTEVPIAPPTAGPIALPTAGPIALPTAGPTKKQKKTSKKSKK